MFMGFFFWLDFLQNTTSEGVLSKSPFFWSLLAEQTQKVNKCAKIEKINEKKKEIADVLPESLSYNGSLLTIIWLNIRNKSWYLGKKSTIKKLKSSNFWGLLNFILGSNLALVNIKVDVNGKIEQLPKGQSDNCLLS